ncbi:MAG: hypothetical protein ACTSV5_13485, partial [Promethearchaeota archaeon]
LCFIKVEDFYSRSINNDNIHNCNLKKRMNLLDLIIFLKDGTQYKLLIDRLKACGTNGNNFFIASKRERIKFPIESLSSFRIESSKGRA